MPFHKETNLGFFPGTNPKRMRWGERIEDLGFSIYVSLSEFEIYLRVNFHTGAFGLAFPRGTSKTPWENVRLFGNYFEETSTWKLVLGRLKAY